MYPRLAIKGLRGGQLDPSPLFNRFQHISAFPEPYTGAVMYEKCRNMQEGKAHEPVERLRLRRDSGRW